MNADKLLKGIRDTLYGQAKPVDWRIPLSTYAEGGVPASYAGLTLSGYIGEGGNPETAKEIGGYCANIAKVVSDPNKSWIGVVLYGPNGTGKTAMAVKIFEAWVKWARNDSRQMNDTDGNGNWVNPAKQFRFMSAFEIGQFFQQSKSASISFQSDVAVLMNLGLLIIDDMNFRSFGTEDPTNPSAAQANFVSFLKRRLSNGLVTIITTNMDVSGMKHFFGPTGMDAVVEHCLRLEMPEQYRVRKPNITKDKFWG